MSASVVRCRRGWKEEVGGVKDKHTDFVWVQVRGDCLESYSEFQSTYAQE